MLTGAGGDGKAFASPTPPAMTPNMAIHTFALAAVAVSVAATVCDLPPAIDLSSEMGGLNLLQVVQAPSHKTYTFDPFMNFTLKAVDHGCKLQQPLSHAALNGATVRWDLSSKRTWPDVVTVLILGNPVRLSSIPTSADVMTWRSQWVPEALQQGGVASIMLNVTEHNVMLRYEAKIMVELEGEDSSQCSLQAFQKHNYYWPKRKAALAALSLGR